MLSVVYFFTTESTEGTEIQRMKRWIELDDKL